MFPVFLQLCVEIDGITASEGGVDAEILANIQQIAQKLFDNVSACSYLCFTLVRTLQYNELLTRAIHPFSPVLRPSSS